MALLTQVMRGLATIKVCVLAYGAERAWRVTYAGTQHYVRAQGVADGYDNIYEVWPPSRASTDAVDAVRGLVPSARATECERT